MIVKNEKCDETCHLKIVNIVVNDTDDEGLPKTDVNCLLGDFHQIHGP